MFFLSIFFRFKIFVVVVFFLCTASAASQSLVGGSFRTRADALINAVASTTIRAKTHETRKAFVFIAARYIMQRDTAKAARQLDTLLNRINAGDAYMEFTTLAVMETYMVCRPYLSTTAKQKIRKYMESVSFHFQFGGTFNLTLMPHAAAYIACEEWPDFKDASGRSPIQVKEYTRDLLEKYMKWIYLEKKCEEDAPTYYPTNLAPIRMLADFSKDTIIQRQAFTTYQSMLAGMNGAYNRGLYVATPPRSKGWTNLGEGIKRPSILNTFAWLLFGESSDQLSFAPFNDVETMLLWLAYPGYSQPLPEILRSDEEKTYPYTRTLKGLSRSYQSTNFGLACWPDVPYGNWKECKRTYLAWQYSNTNSVWSHFTICQDNSEGTGDPAINNPIGYGENPYHRVMQYKGTAMGIWNVPTSYQLYRLYNPFRKSGFKSIIQRDGWVLCHTGSMMFGVKTLEAYTWTDVYNGKVNAEFTFQFVNKRKGTWVLEATEITPTLAGGSFDDQLNRFGNLLVKNTKIDTVAGYSASNNPRVRYTNVDGVELDMTYYAPNENYSGQFRIGGVVEANRTDLLYDDITCYQKFGSEVIDVRVRNQVIRTIVFQEKANNTVTLTPKAGQSLVLSTSIPSVTYHWILPEGSIFLDNTNQYSPTPRVVIPIDPAEEAFDIFVFVDGGKISIRVPTTNVAASLGMIRFNSEGYVFEGFTQNGWEELGTNVPLLNRLTSKAAAAFGLRLLNRTYNGKAIRVRRSTADNAEADIGFTASGMLDTTALIKFAGSNSVYVKTWYDQSGNNRNANQTNRALQPRILDQGRLEKIGNNIAINNLGSCHMSGTSTNTVVDSCYIAIIKSNNADQQGGAVDLGNSTGFRLSVIAGSPNIKWINGGTLSADVLAVANTIPNGTIGQYGFYSYNAGFGMIINGVAAGHKSRSEDNRVGNRLRLMISADNSIDNSKYIEILVFNQRLNSIESKIVTHNQLKAASIK